MAWTTGKNTAQTAAVLVTAGALQDQALGALASLAHKKNAPTVLWGVLVQCTAGWNDGDPVFEYDTSPVLSNTGKTLAQTATALVTAGALQDQAVHTLHSIAWTPNRAVTHWGVLIECTTGWDAGDPRFSYSSSPS